MEYRFLIIKPIRKPRAGWEEAFREMHENDDDEMLIPDIFETEKWED